MSSHVTVIFFNSLYSFILHWWGYFGYQLVALNSQLILNAYFQEHFTEAQSNLGLQVEITGKEIMIKNQRTISYLFFVSIYTTKATWSAITNLQWIIIVNSNKYLVIDIQIKNSKDKNPNFKQDQAHQFLIHKHGWVQGTGIWTWICRKQLQLASNHLRRLSTWKILKSGTLTSCDCMTV